jgi:hypothetical protein
MRFRADNPGVLEFFKRELPCVAGDQKIRLGGIPEICVEKSLEKW